MYLPEALTVLHEFELVPVAPGGKRPIGENWESGLPTATLQEIARRHPTANVGVLARRRPAVDIDITDEACAEAVQMAAEMELGIAPVRVGQAPKRLLMYRTDKPFRKMKVFLTAPDGASKDADGKDYAVEFLGEGQQYVVEGVHPSGKGYAWDTESWWDQPLCVVNEDSAREFLDVLPIYLPPGWTVRSKVAPATSGDEDDDLLLLAQRPLDDWDINRVIADILPYLDPDCGYDEWLRIGQALHHQGEGDPEWLQLWDDWSSAGASWAEGVCSGKWDSFGGYSRRRVTLATLIFETKAARDAARVAASGATVATLRARVANATDLADLEVTISRDARGVKMLEVDREGLAVDIRNRVRELGGNIGLGIVRGWLRPARVTRDTDAAALDAPLWAKEWVFCANGDKFFSLVNKQQVTAFGFRAMHNRLMPVDLDTGERARADVACLEQWSIPVVDNLAYVPWAGAVFEMSGCRWANLFRDDLVPEVPIEMTEEDWDAVRVVQNHAAVMFPDERERELLLSWCAWQVQNPGVKVRWAPYLFGLEGDGKSFWGSLVGSAMGSINVRSITAKVLESPFTGWTVGAAVIMLEEMKQHGHNRFDVMNALKPLITNDVVEVHPKGRDPYMAPNTANYLLLSNYMDGAPVTDSDRRYLFLRSAVELDEVRKMDADGYFGRLFNVVHNRAGAIRAWLLGYDLHPEFSANGRAPVTDVRGAVIEAVKTDLESVLEDVLEDEGFGDTLAIADLVTALKLAGVVEVSDRGIASALGKLGYSFVARVQVNGRRARVWSRKIRTAEEAKTWAAHI